MIVGCASNGVVFSCAVSLQESEVCAGRCEGGGWVSALREEDY